MIKVSRKKALLASLIAVSLTGYAYAAEGDLPASGNGSQSEMYSLTNANAGAGKQITDAEGTSVEEKSEAVEVGRSAEDASLYISPKDEEAVTALAGRTVSEIDITNVPDEVKTSLMSLVTTKTGDALSLESVRADVSAIGSTGVFSQIIPSVTEVPEGVKLNYVTKANPVIHGVNFTGNTVFKSEYLAELMGISENTVLNTTLVNERLQDIEKLYMQQGYILVSIPEVRVTDDGMLDVTVAEGMIEDIVLEGNDKTRDYVILRELRYKKGQPFNKFTASRSMERLYNLGFFEDVNMRLLPGETEHNVITEIDVVEQKTGVISVGAGYSESDGMVGILELGENNFRGMGDKVNFHWEFGGSSHGKNYQISYTRPWINSNGDSLGISFFDRRYDYDDYNSNGNTVASYDKRRKGYSLTWGRVTSEYTKNFFAFESVKESYDDYDGFETGSAWLNKGDGSTYGNKEWYDAIMDNFGTTNSFTFTHVFDNRDNYYSATRGRRLSFSLQYGGHGLGGDYDFYKFTTEGRFYKALGNGHVLALRVMAGYIEGETSYNQLFNLGGSDTLRGYEDDQFKGEKMYAATLEYRVPLAKKVEGVVFTDIGSTWSIDDGRIPWYEDDDSINWSVGVGLRLQTPIGPVRLDYGHGDKNKFHFSFGAQF